MKSVRKKNLAKNKGTEFGKQKNSYKEFGNRLERKIKGRLKLMLRSSKTHEKSQAIRERRGKYE